MWYSPSKHNLKPASKRKPIHRRNNRFLAHPSTDTHEPIQGVLHHLSRLGFRLHLRLLDEVLSRAEGFWSSACDYGDAEGGLRIEPLHQCVGFPVRGVGNGVHAFGAVYGYEEDVGGGVGEEVVGGCWGSGGGLEGGHFDDSVVID